MSDWQQRVCLLTAMLWLGGCEPSAFATRLALDAMPGSAEPHLSRGAEGTVLLSYLEPTINGAALRFHVLNAGRWDDQQTVVIADNLMVNWADFPSVEVLSESLWAAHWLVKQGQDSPGFGYDTVVAYSIDHGNTWSQPISPHTDATATEHGFVSLFPSTQGVGALWLDGRAFADPAATNDSGEQAPITGTQLRSAVIGTQDEVAPTLGAPALIDTRVCDCCQTDLAVTAQGAVAVYRDRTADEIRDIAITRQVNGTWLPGEPVAHDGWQISGCPVNGPAVAAFGNDVVVAWYTAVPHKRVQVAFSHDSGASFDAPIDIQAVQTVGRVDIALVAPDQAVVSWLQAGVGQLSIRTVQASANVGKIHHVAPMEVHRDAGFPQMIRHNDSLIFAWTDTSGDEAQVHSASVEIAALTD